MSRAPLIVPINAQQRVKFTGAVLEQMLRHRQHRPQDLEAGGLLIGRHLESGEGWVVDLVTEPQPGDERSRQGFKRNQAGHQPLLDRAWEASGHTQTAIGDWHTHPEDYPEASLVDMRGWRASLATWTWPDPFLLFVIVGLRTIGVWQGYRGGQIVRLADRLELDRALAPG